MESLMSYTIGSLAKVAEVPIETIRYYQRRGLVPEPAKPLGGIRRYDENHVRRLRFIKRAQVLGFNLDEIADLLALEDGRLCHEAEQLGANKLTIVRERIAQLQRVELALTALVDQCHCNTGQVHCPLIAALERSA
ncbi:MerR family transcriptional regulator [Dyella choica]|uniref:Mercuric resistance operon regulatory protein n=1 Tax=Dyella choica TaxID=1927959 RepID=A0A432M8W1_9GAMM|nr:MerR family transcriptional regulator [Dyella choica]RUL77686.1 MerR family transcriptional regulator [Dyella choica]